MPKKPTRKKKAMPEGMEQPTATMLARRRLPSLEEMRLGRHTAITYTEDLAQEILARVSAGMTLQKIGHDPEMPMPQTILGWVQRNHENFRLRYEQAVRLRSLLWAEQIMDIADDTEGDVVFKKKRDGTGRTGPTYVAENVARAKLKIDTRFKILEKYLPDLFGNRVEVNTTMLPADIAEERRKRRAELYKALDDMAVDAPLILDARKEEV